jgi:hypothetical protein
MFLDSDLSVMVQISGFPGLRGNSERIFLLLMNLSDPTTHGFLTIFDTDMVVSRDIESVSKSWRETASPAFLTQRILAGSRFVDLDGNHWLQIIPG